MNWMWRSDAPPLQGRGLARPRSDAPSRRVAVPDDSAPARLNLFQRTMLRWRELHPYNAVHVVGIPAPLDARRLHDRIKHRLERSGLTGFVLESKRGRLRRVGGRAVVDLKILEGRSDPSSPLWREIEAQLNTPFATDGEFSPFRFFAVDAGDSFRLGVVYDHFVGSGDSIALLLQGIALLYLGTAMSDLPALAPRLVPPPYRSLLWRHPWHVLGAVLRRPESIVSSRRWHRPAFSWEEGGHNAVAHFRLDRRAVAGLRRSGKEWGVTLNDLLLASLLLALSPLAPERSRSQRRGELAVVSIVNLRQDLPSSAAAASGPFLASFRVSHRVPSGTSLRDLVGHVHAETARIKRRRLYLRSIAAMGAGGLMWPLLSPEQRARFFAKNHPVWGGVSTLNVAAIWEHAREGGDPPWEYLRVISTGPACPLVLAVTQGKEELHVRVSFRSAVCSRETIDEVKAGFMRCIEELAGEPEK